MKILIAEDEIVSRRKLKGLLVNWKYEVLGTDSGDAAWEILQRDDAPQLAILDWMMPGLDGPEVCRLVRQKAGGPYTYILLLTGRDSKQDLVAGLEAGADDYLTKPFDAAELRVRLNVGQRILDLQRQLLEANTALRDQATHDKLTGLWNRGAIMDLLGREWGRARRDRFPVGVLMLDVDHFKRVNDTYGHPAGDEVLREVARRLTAALRDYDTVGRYGGEEFLVVLPRCNVEQTTEIAERLRLGLAERPVDLGAESIRVTASIGLTVCEDAFTTDPQAALQDADKALYRAKHGGRNRVEANVPALTLVG